MKVSLADYGVGNLHSIRKALENCGATVNVVEDMSLLTEAECIVLPGVGAFDKTMERLLPYREEIVQRLNDGVPCLGICIGMQIMFQRSAEGLGPGLGFLHGSVVRLKAPRIPHMGWNRVRQNPHALWAGIADGARFYFVHSYCVHPADASVVTGTTEYGIPFTCAVGRDNILAVQFHPEKSAQDGLQRATPQWSG